MGKKKEKKKKKEEEEEEDAWGDDDDVADATFGEGDDDWGDDDWGESDDNIAAIPGGKSRGSMGEGDSWGSSDKGGEDDAWGKDSEGDAEAGDAWGPDADDEEEEEESPKGDAADVVPAATVDAVDIAVDEGYGYEGAEEGGESEADPELGPKRRKGQDRESDDELALAEAKKEEEEDEKEEEEEKEEAKVPDEDEEEIKPKKCLRLRHCAQRCVDRCRRKFPRCARLLCDRCCIPCFDRIDRCLTRCWNCFTRPFIACYRALRRCLVKLCTPVVRCMKRVANRIKRCCAPVVRCLKAVFGPICRPLCRCFYKFVLRPAMKVLFVVFYPLWALGYCFWALYGRSLYIKYRRWRGLPDLDWYKPPEVDIEEGEKKPEEEEEPTFGTRSNLKRHWNRDIRGLDVDRSPTGSPGRSPGRGGSPRSPRMSRSPGRSPGRSSPRSPRGGSGSPGRGGSGSPNSRRNMRKNMRENRMAAKKAAGGESPSKSPSRSRKGKTPTASSSTSPDRRRSPKKGRGAQGIQMSPGRKNKGKNAHLHRPPSRKEKKEEEEEGEEAKVKKTWKEWFEEKKAEWGERKDEIHEILDSIEEEEEFDWANLDEYGNPKRRTFLCPTQARRQFRYVLLMYWDPLLDLVEYVPAMVKYFCRIFLLTPFFVWVGAVVWLGYSLYLNSVHVESTCEIKEMPDSFETQGRVKIEVVGTYKVLRRYPPTNDRSMLAGIAEHSCEVRVPCDSMSWGDSAAYTDDDCAEFDAFNWGDQITCYFHQDDPAGWSDRRLYCLNPPSTLEQEFFAFISTTIVLAGTATCFTYVKYKRAQQRREDADFIHAQQQKEEEELEAKSAVEQKDLDTLREHVDRKKDAKQAKKDAKQEALDAGAQVEQHSSDDDDSDDDK